METSHLILLGALAGGVSFLAPVGLRPVLTKLGTLDIPNHRSSHSRPTLRGAGLAPLLGLLVALLMILSWGSWGGGIISILILTSALLAGAIGFWEDFKGISAGGRATLQMIVALMFCFSLALIWGHGWFFIPVAVVFFVANVNFTNFMDGINGISGLHAISTGVIFSILGIVTANHWLIITSFLLIVVFTPFLFWNFRPPGMFLGDTGSYLLGGLTASIVVASLWSGINPLIVLAPLSIYWVDSLSTLLKRFLKGEPIFKAHRMHVYQRLTDLGITHVRVASAVALLTLLSGLSGFATLLGGWQYILFSLFFLSFCWGFYLTLPTVYVKKKVKG